MAAEPTPPFSDVLPEWNNNETNISAPSPAQKSDGWTANEKPTSAVRNDLETKDAKWINFLNDIGFRDWKTGVVFVIGDRRIDPNTDILYKVNTAHTSTGASLTENDLAKWDVVSKSLNELLGPLVDGDMAVGDTATGNFKKSTVITEVAPIVAFDPGVINGSMDTWQENTSQLPATSGQYFADLFQYTKNGPQTHDITRSTDVPTLSDGAPFTPLHSIQILVQTLNTALDVNENTVLTYKQEGLDFTRYFGQKFTLNFWVKGNNTGTYSVAFTNAANDRAFIANFSVLSTGVWKEKTITLTHDVTGAWNLNTNTGLQVKFVLAAASNFEASATDQWEGGDFLTVDENTNFDETAANQLNIALVSINSGSIFINNIRTVEADFPRIARQFRRYTNLEYAFRKDSGDDEARYAFQFNPQMRAAPAVTFSVNSKSGNVSDPTTTQLSQDSMSIQFVSGNAVDENVIINFDTFLNARL